MGRARRSNGVTGDITLITNGSERIRITNSGGVGIGTQSPQCPLDVYSSNYAGTGTNSYRYFAATNDILTCSSSYIEVEKWANYCPSDKVFVYGTEDPEVLSVDKVELSMAALGG